MSSSVLLIFIFTFCVCQISGYNLTVWTKNGYVEGFKQISRADSNTYYYAFKGIPFAEPPIGALRFQDPRPAQPWKGVKQTKSFKSACAAPQNSHSNSAIVGSEDCLYVNVYVPSTEKDNKNLSLPVMVWFHGGAFVRGNPFTNPDYLLEKPVIMVVLAYRLGVLGFLSTQDGNAWGNAGLKDQSLALQWVKDNIEYFGGNSNKITIFGQSAGGASIEYHLVSPRSAGLFAQAIVQSGSTLNEWGVQKNPIDLTSQLAKTIGILSNDTKEIVQKLQEVDYVSLISNASRVTSGRFQPSVEVDHEGVFVNISTYYSWTSRKFNKVPVLIGHTSEDGSYGSALCSQYPKNHKVVIPAGLNIDTNSKEADEVVEKVSALYFPDNSYNNYTRCIDFMTQHYFVRGIRKTIADLVKTTLPVYYYRFSYVTTANYTLGVNGGAGHGEDALYYLYRPLYTKEDQHMKDIMVTLLTNFATYGNPTPTSDPVLGNVIWPEARDGVKGEDDVRYLEIGKQLVPGMSPFQKDFLFWRELFSNYSSGTIYTY